MPTADMVARLRPASDFHAESSSLQSYWSRRCVTRARSPVLSSNHNVWRGPTGGGASTARGGGRGRVGDAGEVPGLVVEPHRRARPDGGRPLDRLERVPGEERARAERQTL